MNIEYVYNTSFSLDNESEISKWLNKSVESEGFSVGEVVYAFFNDSDLKKLNIKYLNHDFFTDVISFNDSNGNVLKGNIAISVDRVKENSIKFKTSFNDEMMRVMFHGLLHFMGYNDSNEDEKTEMTKKENEKIKMFHVEH